MFDVCATERSLGRSTARSNVASRATGGVSAAETAAAATRGIRYPTALMGSLCGAARRAGNPVRTAGRARA
jgi:hypothetical protein